MQYTMLTYLYFKTPLDSIARKHCLMGLGLTSYNHATICHQYAHTLLTAGRPLQP